MGLSSLFSPVYKSSKMSEKEKKLKRKKRSSVKKSSSYKSSDRKSVKSSRNSKKVRGKVRTHCSKPPIFVQIFCRSKLILKITFCRLIDYDLLLIDLVLLFNRSKLLILIFCRSY